MAFPVDLAIIVIISATLNRSIHVDDDDDDDDETHPTDPLS